MLLDPYWSSRSQYALPSGLVWSELRIQLQSNPITSLHEIFALAHDEQNHCGYYRAYERIRATYYVRRLARRLRLYLSHCRSCNLNQTKRHQPYGELRPIQAPPIPFHTVTIDFIAGLPSFNDFDMALTVTCKASKRCTILPGKSTYSAADWATTFLEGTIDWGLPKIGR